MTAPLGAYLDTCVVSGLAREDLPDVELAAQDQILDAQKRRLISLVTSRVTKEEIEKIPQSYRRKHQTIYNLLADIPVAKAFRRNKPWSLLPWDLGVRLQPMLAQLITTLPDEADARHIYQAAQNGVQYFVTTDYRTILAHRAKIERIAGIKAASPREFAAIMSNVDPTHA
ncbi:hypothetical protein [Nitrospira sp. Nam80]